LHPKYLKSVPRGLKALNGHVWVARLKPCPSYKAFFRSL
jgi:hypothetical protein